MLQCVTDGITLLRVVGNWTKVHSGFPRKKNYQNFSEMLLRSFNNRIHPWKKKNIEKCHSKGAGYY